MTQHFDQLIDSYIDQHIGIADQFISASLAKDLKTDLELKYQNQLFHQARIGNNHKRVREDLIRNDEIYWLSKDHESGSEHRFFTMIDAFVAYLNETCFTGIQSYEFQYAKYGVGSFYKKHYDQFKNNNDRAYTMIIYLNENWLPGDGGELCIHQNSTTQLITPLQSKCVFFKSNELEHEVFVSNKIRYSISGWFKTH